MGGGLLTEASVKKSSELKHIDECSLGHLCQITRMKIRVNGPYQDNKCSFFCVRWLWVLHLVLILETAHICWWLLNWQVWTSGNEWHLLIKARGDLALSLFPSRLKTVSVFPSPFQKIRDNKCLSTFMNRRHTNFCWLWPEEVPSKAKFLRKTMSMSWVPSLIRTFVATIEMNGWFWQGHSWEVSRYLNSLASESRR